MEHQNEFSSDDDGNGLSSDSNEEIELEDLDSFDGDAPYDSGENFTKSVHFFLLAFASLRSSP